MKTLLLIIMLFVGPTADFEKFAYETFEITEISNGEIRGELLLSTENVTNEGIYLDETYYDLEELRGLKVGDKIIVSYNKDDYYNEYWDKIENIARLPY